MKRLAILATASLLGSLTLQAQAGPGGAGAAGATGAGATAAATGPTTPAAGVHGAQASSSGPGSRSGQNTAPVPNNGTVNSLHPGGPTGPNATYPNYTSPPSAAGTNAPGTGVKLGQ